MKENRFICDGCGKTRKIGDLHSEINSVSLSGIVLCVICVEADKYIASWNNLIGK